MCKMWWTTYDGTPDTLPEEGKAVCLESVGRTKGRFWLDSKLLAHLRWENNLSIVKVRTGDKWMYWPEDDNV